jgi:hypothetical protein
MKRATHKRKRSDGSIVEYAVTAKSGSVYLDNGPLRLKWAVEAKGQPHEPRAVYICDDCQCLVAWFRSERTGKNFLCNVTQKSERWGGRRSSARYSEWYFVPWEPHFKSCVPATTPSATTDTTDEELADLAEWLREEDYERAER